MLGNWSLGDYFKQEQLPAGLDLPDREGRARPEPDLRLLLHRRPGPRHPQGHRVGRDLDAAVHRGRGQRRPGRGRHRGARRRGRHRRRPDRLLRQEELVVPRRRRRVDAGRRAGRTRHARCSTSIPQIEHDPAYGAHCHQNCDCGRFIEIGNSVFMEYQRTETGFEPLPRKNVDYGGGLARIAAAVDRHLRRLPDQPALADHREARRSCPARPTRTRPSPCGSSPTTCAARRSSPSTASGRATRPRATSCAG